MKTFTTSIALMAMAASAPAAAHDLFYPWASAHWELSDFASVPGASREEVRDHGFAPWLSQDEASGLAKASAGNTRYTAGFSPWG
jgi:hypothetical protein